MGLRGSQPETDWIFLSLYFTRVPLEQGTPGWGLSIWGWGRKTSEVDALLANPVVGLKVGTCGQDKNKINYYGNL
jgi:hypothetical protein